MVAAVATEEPEIAANSPQLTIVATANPPGQWPTQACTALNRSRPTPPLSNTFDINRNSGTASKMNPSNVERIACGAIKGENPPRNNIPRPMPPSANATGTPIKRRLKRQTTMTSIVIRDYLQDSRCHSPTKLSVHKLLGQITIKILMEPGVLQPRSAS